MSASLVIGWKFNHTPGMCTANDVITAFPISTTDRDGNHTPVLDRDGVERTALTMPTQIDIGQWTAEYDVWMAAKPIEKSDKELIVELKSQLAKIQQEITKAVPNYKTVELADVPDESKG